MALKMFLWDDLHPEKFSALPFFFKAYYAATGNVGHRSWHTSVLTGVHIEAPEIFLFPIGQFCTPPETQYPLMQLVQYISYFLASIFFAIEIRIDMTWSLMDEV